MDYDPNTSSYYGYFNWNRNKQIDTPINKTADTFDFLKRQLAEQVAKDIFDYLRRKPRGELREKMNVDYQNSKIKQYIRMFCSNYLKNYRVKTLKNVVYNYYKLTQEEEINIICDGVILDERFKDKIYYLDCLYYCLYYKEEDDISFTKMLKYYLKQMINTYERCITEEGQEEEEEQE